MRILVFGAGAVGSALGGLLARDGHGVVLLGRRDHMAAVRERGLTIGGIWGSHHVTGMGTASSLEEIPPGPIELVLLTVKAYDTAAAAEALGRIEASRAAVVSVQNGYGNVERLEQALGAGRVFGARIITGVELIEPGRVEVTVSADDIRLGPPAGERDLMPRAHELAAMLRSAAIPGSATDRYREYLWDKILYNCALNPLGALLRAPYGQLARDGDIRGVMDRIMQEGHTAARSASIPLFWDTAEAYRRHFYDDLIPPTAGHYPSMLRDLERRGRTEIDSLNGALVAISERSALAAPENRTLTAMIKLREHTRQAELARDRAG